MTPARITLFLGSLLAFFVAVALLTFAVIPAVDAYALPRWGAALIATAIATTLVAGWHGMYAAARSE